MLTSPQGQEILLAFKLDFHYTNNEAKYEALITGLKLGKDVGVEKIEIFLDSMLVVQ